MVVLTDIYPAFERPIAGVDISSLVEILRHHHDAVTYLPRGADFVHKLRAFLRPGDFVIGFGAGDLGNELHHLAQIWAQKDQRDPYETPRKRHV